MGLEMLVFMNLLMWVYHKVDNYKFPCNLNNMRASCPKPPEPKPRDSLSLGKQKVALSVYVWIWCVFAPAGLDGMIVALFSDPAVSEFETQYPNSCLDVENRTITPLAILSPIAQVTPKQKKEKRKAKSKGKKGHGKGKKTKAKRAKAKAAAEEAKAAAEAELRAALQGIFHFGVPIPTKSNCGCRCSPGLRIWRLGPRL